MTVVGCRLKLLQLLQHFEHLARPLSQCVCDCCRLSSQAATVTPKLWAPGQSPVSVCLWTVVGCRLKLLQLLQHFEHLASPLSQCVCDCCRVSSQAATVTATLWAPSQSPVSVCLWTVVGCRLKLLQLLQHFEHLASPLSQCVCDCCRLSSQAATVTPTLWAPSESPVSVCLWTVVGCRLKLLQLLQHFEHLASPLSQCVCNCCRLSSQTATVTTTLWAPSESPVSVCL